MIVPARGDAEATLSDMVSLMRMLLREERSAYDAAMAAAVEADGVVNPLAALHHAATFQQHVCKLIELLLGAPDIWRVKPPAVLCCFADWFRLVAHCEYIRVNHVCGSVVQGKQWCYLS